MSVIWSGVTEEGAVVPVQVTAEGKVVAVGDGPEGEYLKLTGGNLTGNLTVNEQITLATNGSATFSGGISLNEDGSATFFGGDVNIDSSGNLGLGTATPNAKLQVNSGDINIVARSGDAETGIFFRNPSDTTTYAKIGYIDLSGTLELGTTNNYPIVFITNDTQRMQIDNAGDITATGNATFAGEVVIGSRGEQWLIRESNGVAMLIQQTLRGETEPREREKLRDLPNELDLIEAALNEVMGKLQMTPPAGWPVWDGQSEATSDNDNA